MSTNEYHIRHRVVLKRVAVELVDGSGKLLERLGHQFDDELNPAETKTYGPFNSKQDALNDEHACVETT